MATYTLRTPAGRGITSGHGASIMAEVEDLVNYAAANVSWNRLSSAPEGFEPVEVTKGRSTTIERVHKASGVKFAPGFHMYRVEGGDQKWEGRTPPGTGWRYRLDLQSISDNGANFSLQTNGGNSVTVAVCMMELNKSFGRRQLIEGLKRSAENAKICDLTQ